MNHNIGFDNKKYIRAQFKKFNDEMKYQGPVYIEFGGKAFGDFHASRVLPGYDPDIKLRLLKELSNKAKIVMVVNTKDILPAPLGRTKRGRIRGDTGLRYDYEVLRVLKKCSESKIRIDSVVLSVFPRDFHIKENSDIYRFVQALKIEGYPVYYFSEIPNYPLPSVIRDSTNLLLRNAELVGRDENLVVISPGGGSGKFGVILSEICHKLKQEILPKYVKFETFPVYKLPTSHPLNLAYLAASADLGNKIFTIENGDTNYDKDIENFLLLKELYRYYNHDNVNLKYSTDFGVNQIDKGILDEDIIRCACLQEVRRRYARYKQEVSLGIENQKTLSSTREILGQFR